MDDADVQPNDESSSQKSVQKESSEDQKTVEVLVMPGYICND